MLSLNKPKLDNLANEIWKSAERLRGKFKAYEYQSVILPIIVIRRLECVLLAWREAKSAEVLAKRPQLTEGGEGVRVFIGSENKLFSLSGSSLVVSPYMNADRKIIGAVGVIGPTRLNYGRIVPIVDYTAQLVGRLLSSRG